MSNPVTRFLMLCLFVALQAMTPFIHAHAGAVQLDHAGFLHVHQDAHGDAAWHVVAAGEHGAEVEVAQGMPLRHDSRVAVAEAPAMTSSPALLRVDAIERLGAGVPAPPPPRLALPDHTLPHALAPPFA